MIYDMLWQKVKLKLKVYINLLVIKDTIKTKKARKGAWRMPWLSEAMKDVISCDKLRLGANDPWPGDFRMGQPNQLKTDYPA